MTAPHGVYKMLASETAAWFTPQGKQEKLNALRQAYTWV